MKLERFGFTLFLVLAVCFTAHAEDTSLTRADVAAIKAKLVKVQQAMGTDPDGYIKDSEDFYLPTDANPAKDGKFWPITSSVSVRYTDRATRESQANAEKASRDFEARYSAALASGDMDAVMKLQEEMMRMSQAAAAAGANGSRKDNMNVSVQFNMSPYAGIDPDAVVFESPGVIALRDLGNSGDMGQVIVYLDPVALAKTETLSKIELKTPEGGVTNKAGIFNITITLNGAVADATSWAKTFKTRDMLSVIDVT